jgi:2-keto-3-deoxy-L-rhamnonate aldolase
VLTIGGVAAIDALAGIFPRVLVRLYRLFLDSAAKGITTQDFAQMREIQYRICQGEKIVAKWGVVGTKEALARIWQLGDGKGGRLPLAGGFEDGDREWEGNWKKTFEGLKELEQQFEKEDSK